METAASTSKTTDTATPATMTMLPDELSVWPGSMDSPGLVDIPGLSAQCCAQTDYYIYKVCFPNYVSCNDQCQTAAKLPESIELT